MKKKKLTKSQKRRKELRHGPARKNKQRKSLNSFGIKANKKFGQNFLRSKEVIDAEINALSIASNEHILEIGPGTGSLTRKLISKAGKLTLIEIDKQFRPILEDLSKNYRSKTSIIWDSATKANLIKKLDVDKVISNLPYNQTLPILFNLLENSKFKLGIFLIQADLAKRLAARPGSPGYSRISVYTQSFCQINLLNMVHPSAFYPEPMVESATIEVIPFVESEEIKVLKTNAKAYKSFLEICFEDRQATLLENLKTHYSALSLPKGLSINKPVYKVDVETFRKIFLGSGKN